MPNLSSVIKQLREERDRVEKQLSGLDAALKAFVSVYSGKPSRKRRKMSVAARKKIATAQRRRWAKVRKSKV
jgi:hypothetical protein